MGTQNIFISTSCLSGQEKGFYESDVLAVLDAYEDVPHIELGAAHLSPYQSSEEHQRYVSQLKKRISDLTLLGKRFSVHGPFPPLYEHFMINPASQDEQYRNESLRIISESIRFAVAIGADLYSFHPGSCADIDIWGKPLGKIHRRNRAFNTALNSIQSIIEKSFCSNLRLAVETMEPDPQHLFNQVSDFRKLFKKLGYFNNLGILLDVGHVLNQPDGEQILEKYLEEFSHKIFAFHLHQKRDDQPHQLPSSPDFYHRFKDTAGLKILEAHGLSIEEILDEQKKMKRFLDRPLKIPSYQRH